MKGLRLLLATLTACAAFSVLAADCRALIVSGDPGHEPHAAARFTAWTSRWAALLQDTYGFKPGNVRVLRSPKRGEQAKGSAAETATHASVLAALSDLVRDSSDGDQVLLVLIGHGYDSQNVSRLCLPGQDLSDVESAQALQKLRARQFICINTAPAGSGWAKALAGKGRIIVVASATSGLRSQTYFNEFLLRALTPGTAGQAGSGTARVTLLDAFNRAALQTIRWYQNQFLDKDVTKVHGKEFQEIFHAMYPDKTMETGGAAPLAPNNNMEDTAGWLGRRVLAEAAGLEDNGDGEASSVYEDGKEPHPLPSKSGDGEASATIVLGKP